MNFFKKGLELHQAGNLKAAREYYQISLKNNPTNYHTLNYLGILQSQLGNFTESLNIFKKAISVKADDAKLYCNIANIYLQLRELDNAVQYYNKAIKLDPNFFEAHCNLGTALQEYNNKKSLESAIISFNKAIAINSNFYLAYNNRGNVLKDLGKLKDAVDSYNQSLKINPNYAVAHSNLGDVLVRLNEPLLALKSYEKCIEINEEYKFVFGRYLHAKMLACNWKGLQDDLKKLETNINLKKNISPPFDILSLTEIPELQLLATKSYVEFYYPENNNLGIIIKGKLKKKIRIGYFSSDFLHDQHPIPYLTQQLFETHDRKKFEIIAFSLFQNDNGFKSEKLVKSFDKFLNVADKSDKEIAKLSRELNIDIAIDLTGHTGNSRFGIFSYRAAPIQVNFLGYTGTSGSNYIDYIIADENCIPKELKIYYSEKICYLPNCYFPFSTNLEQSNKSFSREKLGLPKTSFVFASFNSSYKITPSIFSSWMHILKSTNNSVLWLSNNNEWASNNLKKECIKNSVNSDRIFFSNNNETAANHLERQKNADIMLDTYPYGGHTTTINALWSGLPVLTRMGKTFASRVASSLLSTIELPELITYTQEDYQAKAIELANNTEQLKKIKEKLLKNKSKIFDTLIFSKHLETAYRKMYEHYQSGLVPQDIYIKENNKINVLE